MVTEQVSNIAQPGDLCVQRSAPVLLALKNLLFPGPARYYSGEPYCDLYPVNC
jgi:hypothetical protein